MARWKSISIFVLFSWLAKPFKIRTQILTALQCILNHFENWFCRLSPYFFSVISLLKYCIRHHPIFIIWKIIREKIKKEIKNQKNNHTKYYSRVFDSILICHKQYVWNSLRVIQKWANQNHSLIQRPQPHILHWCTHLLDVSRHQTTEQNQFTNIFEFFFLSFLFFFPFLTSFFLC